MENETPDVLQEFTQESEYTDATKGQRFLNYLIDLFAYYLIVLAVFVVVILIEGNADSVERMAENPQLIERLLALFFYGLFMSVIEGMSKGRSLGKLITRTMAIHEDGTPIGWDTAFKRGLSRMVPFEPFSALMGAPWHDRWTKTRVVKMKKYF